MLCSNLHNKRTRKIFPKLVGQNSQPELIRERDMKLFSTIYNRIVGYVLLSKVAYWIATINHYYHMTVAHDLWNGSYDLVRRNKFVR